MRSLYAVCSLSRRPSAFMRRLLNAAGEKGSAVPLGKRAVFISRERNSSSMISFGRSFVLSVFSEEDLGEKNPNRPVVWGFPVAGLDTSIGIVGLFFSFPVVRSGDVDREVEDGGADSSVSPTGIPKGTGADVPENQDPNPPFDLSATFMTPSLSPVRVAINSTMFSFFVLRSGEVEFSLGEREGDSVGLERWRPQSGG